MISFSDKNTNDKNTFSCFPVNPQNNFSGDEASSSLS